MQAPPPSVIPLLGDSPVRDPFSANLARLQPPDRELHEVPNLGSWPNQVEDDEILEDFESTRRLARPCSPLYLLSTSGLGR